MWQYSANDLEHRSLPKIPNLVALDQGPSDQFDDLRAGLEQLVENGGLGPGSAGSQWGRRITRQLLPDARYPRSLRGDDTDSLDDYLNSIPQLEGADKPPKDTTNSPTILAIGQKVYDGEVTRRESINSRCTGVLSTAGILSALFVDASQLGLNPQNGPVKTQGWFVLGFFLVALAYLVYTIIIALRVHGDIQGEAIDLSDLIASNPQSGQDDYNYNVAKFLLIGGKVNWSLNNNFKYRLNSAGRALRNGVIAISIAGALSPWALTATNSGTASAPFPTTYQASSAWGGPMMSTVGK
jgi:hypothetical protein